MTTKHLLFWIFDYLVEKHPAIYYELRDNLKGSEKESWVKAALHERMDAYKSAIKKE